MRFFIFLDIDAGAERAVISTLESDRVPGKGGVLPDNGREVTEEQYRAIVAVPGTVLRGDVFELPAPRPPVVSKTDFALLFSRAQRAAIRAFRAGQVDDDVEDFYALLQLADGPIDLASPIVAAGLALMVEKELLTAPEAERIASGQAPGAR